MKTNKLTGAALDWAVGMAIGEYKPVPVPNYSTDWAQGGPIIEREEISVNWASGQWEAHTVTDDDNFDQIEYAPTPLIAAMRCYVASKLGDEIELPEVTA